MPFLAHKFNRDALKLIANKAQYSVGLNYAIQGCIDQISFSSGTYTGLFQNKREFYKPEISVKNQIIEKYSCNCDDQGFCRHLVCLALTIFNNEVSMNETQEALLILASIITLAAEGIKKDDLAFIYKKVTNSKDSINEIKSLIDISLSELIKTGQITTNPYKINYSQSYYILEDLRSSPYAKRVIDSVREWFNRNSLKKVNTQNYHSYYLARLAFSYYSCDEVMFKRNMNDLNSFLESNKFLPELVPEEMLFFIYTLTAEDFGYEKLQKQPEIFQYYLRYNALSYFRRQGIKSKVVNSILDDDNLLLKPGSDIQKLYLDSLLLDLRLERLQEYVSKFTDDYKYSYYEASVYFLKSRFQDAFNLYEKSLKQARKECKDKNLSIEGINGIFYILSMIVLDEASNATTIQKNITKNYYKDFYSRVYSLIGDFHKCYFKDDQASSKADPYLDYDYGVYQSYLLYSFSRLFNFFTDKDKINQKVLLNNLLELQSSAALCYKITRDVARALNHSLEENPSLDEASLLDFTTLFKPAQVWQKKINLLRSHFILDTKLNAKRVVWILDYATKSLKLKKQSILKSGNWSAGQVYDLETINRFQDESILTRAEKEIINKSSDYHNMWYLDDGDDLTLNEFALLKLCGQENIYLDANLNHRVVLLASKPSLELVDTKNGFYKLKFSHDFNEECVLLERKSAKEIRVLHCDDKLVKLKELIDSGLELPYEAEDQIKDILKAAQATLEVHSDLDYEDLKKLEASSKAYLLVFFDAVNYELKLDLFINPALDGKNLVKAGVGREMLKVENIETAEKLLYKRNFDAEKECFLQVQKLLKIEKSSAQFNGVDACLDAIYLLEKIHLEYPDLIDVEWKQGQKLKVLAKTNYSSVSMNIKSKNNWFEYSGEVKIDEDKVINLTEVLNSLETSSGSYVKLSSGEFLGITEELKKSLSKLKYISDAASSRIHGLASSNLEELEKSGANLNKDKEWQAYLDKVKNFNKLNLKLPKEFNAQLRDYQYEGFVWLSRLAYLGAGACLADDMGLGKTVQAIAVLVSQIKTKPCMVVAPTSVINNWKKEIDKFTTGIKTYMLSDFPAQGDERKKLLDGLGPNDLLLASYGLLQNEIDDLSQKDFAMLILDESQAVKNPVAKRTLAVKKLQADFRLVLTGTPIENNLTELWSQFDFINPGLLGSLRDFQGKYANAIEVNKNKDAQAALKSLIQPYLLRRNKKNVLSDLPDKIEQNLVIEFDPDEAAFYESLRKKAVEILAETDGLDTNMGKRKLQILAEISKLRRACCHPKLVGLPGAGNYKGSKNHKFLELVLALKASGHKALVFSQYTSYLDMIKQYLNKLDVNYLYLDGSTPIKKRQKLVDEFQNGEADLFLLSIKAGGAGLNLTEADYVIHLDPWWNPAVEDQATDRAHRIGQKKTVNVYRLIMKNSIEEKILQLHDSKREIADELLEEADMSAKLSDKELLALMSP
jgi:SNF2 family DNA or RNA helicase